MTRLYCVSKLTSHRDNNLYPVKNRKSFQWEKNNSGYIAVMPESRNQMQTGCRIRCLFESRDQSQGIRDIQYRIIRQGNSQVSIKSQITNFQKCKQGRQGLDKTCNQTKGVLYTESLINWLTWNRHRIKINVLTVWHRNRLEYLYTGILKTLKGSWEVRTD